jgi:Arc/MetJ-type ribon-helix-helix transcriptional regulator
MTNPYDPPRPGADPEPIDDLMLRDDEAEDQGAKGPDRERLSSSMRDTLHRIPESLSSIGRDISRTIERAISAKDDYVVAVKLSAEAQDKLDQLVQAGVFRSRAEAAAFLIDEGTKAQAELFARVAQKLSEIERLRAELRGMVSREE